LANDLFYFGLTQKTAPLSIRERLRADRQSQIELFSNSSGLAEGRMVLATCERFEIYASGRPSNCPAWTRWLADSFALSASQLSSFLRIISGPDVAGHLIRVAAGLDSRIVGERQILGQVRNAHTLALEQGALDAQLSLLVRTAIRAGKRVRRETPLDSGRSIVTLAMDWLADSREEIQNKTVGVVGSGRLAALVVGEVARRRPRQLIVTGRNQRRAAELAGQFHASHSAVAALPRTLSQCDIVFACTASPTYLVDATTLCDPRAASLLLIDLCVPRNVHPAVANLPSVKLAHLDEMVAHMTGSGRLALAAPQAAAIGQAEKIVAEELAAFSQWRRERGAAPKIAALVRRAAHLGLCKRALHEQITRLKAGVAI
jgi:glutamyl-tRNA reductase